MRPLILAAMLVASGAVHAQTVVQCTPDGPVLHCYQSLQSVIEQSQTGRAYTLAEIDRMRKAVWELLAHCSQWQHEGICYAADPATIEDRLRTYIAAGISPEALEAEAKTADH